MTARRPPIIRRGTPALHLLPAGLVAGLALLLSGCPTTPVPAGNLAVPGALAAAPDAQQDGDYVIFIAEGDGLDLRAFSNRYHLFVRGPNAINALSIPLTLSMNGQQLPTFRPTQLAGGQITEPNGAGMTADAGMDAGSDAGSTTLGFVAVAGAANPPRVAVVDAQSDQVTLAAEDAALCEKDGGISVSCLPEDAIDVVATSAHVYALLAPDAAGIQSFISMTPKVENGVPVLTLDLAPTALPPGQYGRIAVSADDTFLYAGSLTAPAVVQVLLPLLPAHTLTVTYTATTRPDLQGVGVAVPVVTPVYPGSPGGYILAVLTDGRVLTLDTALPTTAATAEDANGAPLSPMIFNAPAQNIVFMPCTGVGCQTAVRYDTGGSSVVNSPAPAFVALGDGTAVPILPDNTSPNPQPQIFRIYNTTSPATPSVGSQSPWTDDYGSAAATDSLTIGGATTGYSVNETVTVTFHGEVAGYQGRSGTLQQGAGSLTLTDTEGTAAFQPTADCPTSATPLPCVGDIVKITGDLSGDCSAAATNTAVNQELRITALTTAGQAVLNPLSNGICVPGRVAYEVLAARGDQTGGATCTAAQITARTCGPWTVSGTTNGYLGRAVTTPPAAGSAGTFFSPEPQYYYPCNTANCSTTTPPATAQAFTLEVVALESNGMIVDPPNDGIFFTFSVVSGVTPFVLSSVDSTDGITTTATTGLTYGLAAIPDWLYTTAVGANGLNEFNIPNYTLAGGANFYD